MFAAGLNFPNGVLAAQGGVFVTAAPDILFLADTDGDRPWPTSGAVVFTGFAEGNQQLRANGLTWGLDNWIYGANGRSDGNVRRPDDPPETGRLDSRPRFPLSTRRQPLRSHERPQPIRSGRRRLGQPFSVLEHHPHAPGIVRAKFLDRNPRLSVLASVTLPIRPTPARCFRSARARRRSIASEPIITTPCAA